MIVKAMLMAVMVSVAGAGPWMVGESAAAAIPEYFDDELVGFACLTAVAPGGAPTQAVLQLNFDKLAGGGISLTQADALFAKLTSSFGWLGQLIGATLQATCAFTPSQIQASNPGLTARQAVDALAPTFQGRGFAAYLVLDSFRTVTPSYLGSNVAIRRTDAFTVVGPNNVTYLGSNDVVEPPAP